MKGFFILTEPAVPENIGAAARAMKTMGFTNMRLVNPCNHLAEEARWLAHASNDILEKAEVFGTLEEALADIDFSIATSAKKRSVKADYHTPDKINGLIARKSATISNYAIVFGREESGLTNEEISRCDVVSSIPLKTTYPSLNLGQSVMLYAYELSPLNFKAADTPETLVDSSKFGLMKAKVQEVMNSLRMQKQVNLYNRIPERLNALNSDDINLVLSVCQKILKKLAKDKT